MDQQAAAAVGHFRKIISDLQRYRKHEASSWVCVECGIEAEKHFDKPECHTCSDWGGCGRECTLSSIECPKCGRLQDV